MKTIQATLQKDVYKEFHVHAYHPDVKKVYSNYTNRNGKLSNIKDNNGAVFLGLQYFIKEYLINTWNKTFFQVSKDEALDNHKHLLSNMLGYQVDVNYLGDLHDLGYLPLEIKALPEGTIVPYQVPCLTIVNTVDGFQWLTNMVETILSCYIWSMSTSGATSKAYYDTFMKYADETSDTPELVKFQGHDFSFRGMFGLEAAAMSGFAHLCSGFVGTDTIPAVKFAEDYYNSDSSKQLVGCSVNATEHSVTCSWQNEGEIEFFKYLMNEVSPKGVLSIVSDTWDFWKVVTEFLPELKEDILSRDGKVVIRPDSGDPVDIICGVEIDNSLDKEVYHKYLDDGDLTEILIRDAKEIILNEIENTTPHGVRGDSIAKRYFKICEELYLVSVTIFWDRLDKQYYFVDYDYSTAKIEKVILNPEQKGLIECLWDIFGGTINSKGYKVLNDKIGAIYGDSITLERQEKILKRLKEKGFASTNIVLGIGSYTYQYVTRDTHGTAVKATAVYKDNAWVPIYKEPKTDKSKKSLKGLLKVYEENGGLKVKDNCSVEEEKQGLLKTIYKDGMCLVETSLKAIRSVINDYKIR
jgi:nicotinamide phosphoribosyltransferase